MIGKTYIVQTDFGTVPMPADMRADFRMAPKRKDGQPDLRYAIGRRLKAREREINKEAEAKYIKGR